jgi:hypothetical protein
MSIGNPDGDLVDLLNVGTLIAVCHNPAAIRSSRIRTREVPIQAPRPEAIQ